MGQRVVGLSMWIHFQADASPQYLVIDYKRMAEEPTSGGTVELRAYEAQFQTPISDLPIDLQNKLVRFSEYAISAVDIPEILVGEVSVKGTATTPSKFTCRTCARWKSLASSRVPGE